MAHLIDKDALVAEIESLKSAAETMLTGKMDLSYWRAQKCLCERLLSFINDLEVKEVDLDFTKEVDVWIEDNGDTNGFFNVQDLAKHFFELGLKAQKGE